ncbi:BEN domain-containing protein 6 isoform X3 [Accipiter gentilis]|uniref:BEN domain-containing protein 6 isoform X3 n=1 Tax=Astur gentilis TaxID=8957 RepID=UPI00210F4F14|nr:BEN domain-containing protein 6 isoform X3 [Accipiter gentilis]
MKKFTLFDFVNDNSLQIGETSWIQDLPSDDSELERLLKPNEHVLVNWPVGKRKTEKHLVKIVYMSDDPQELVQMMQKILRADEITKIQVLGKGKRKRIEMIFSESEDSDLDKEQGKMMKHIKRNKSLQASAPANILSQLETSLINKQREPYSGSNFLYSESSSDDEEPLFQLSKVELCAKIKSLKRKLKDTMRENCRLRQSLVMLQGITKQLFPNTDDALIRRMMGQKLNNCTKKPILSKDLNSGAFQKHSFCGSTATSQGIISSAVPLSTQDQQDDDSLAANAQIQQSDSCLTLSPPTPQGQQECFKPTSKMESHLIRSSPVASPNQGCGQDLRNTDKE